MGDGRSGGGAAGDKGRKRRRAGRAGVVRPGATLRREGSATRQRGAKLVSRVELQLAKDAREVPLDRTRSDEEGLGNLAIGEALTGELGDSALACRQRVQARGHHSARAGPG